VIPVLVGGSGLYVSSVLYEFEFPGTDPELRERLEKRLEAEGREALVRELAEQDPLAAVAIDSRNSRRLIRALEVVILTGKPFGAGLDAQRHRWQENLVVLGLHTERETLVPALDARVERMWEEGLVDEARLLLPRGLQEGVTASKAIGYQQALAILDGSMSESEAIESTQALTRRYARRQVSWFRRDDSIAWFESEDERRVVDATALVLGALA
jgi:tRNA dimethylallyltransferase